MSDVLTSTKESLGRALDLLGRAQGVIPEGEVTDILTRLQMARNTLIQNERKIWLKTKDGKEMLAGFHAAAAKLREAAEHIHSREPAAPLEGLRAALAEVENQAKKLDEESRRRSMVVT